MQARVGFGRFLEGSGRKAGGETPSGLVCAGVGREGPSGQRQSLWKNHGREPPRGSRQQGLSAGRQRFSMGLGSAWVPGDSLMQAGRRNSMSGSYRGFRSRDRRGVPLRPFGHNGIDPPGRPLGGPRRVRSSRGALSVPLRLPLDGLEGHEVRRGAGE